MAEPTRLIQLRKECREIDTDIETLKKRITAAEKKKKKIEEEITLIQDAQEQSALRIKEALDLEKKRKESEKETSNVRRTLLRSPHR